MTRKLSGLIGLAVLATTGAVAIAATNGGEQAKSAAQKPLRYEAHDLYIETNSTDRDVGLQVSVDAENWRRFKLFDTKGDRMVDLNTFGRTRRVGLSELFFEASEPSFDQVPLSEFKQRFPEGTYRFRGRTSGGRRIVGSDHLTHVIPRGPNLTFPTKGAALDPDGFQVNWKPVTKPAGVKIVTYQVIVEQGKRELSMYLPGDATSATIPGEFLEPDTKTVGEVLAREKSGNQTITQFPEGLRTGG